MTFLIYIRLRRLFGLSIRFVETMGKDGKAKEGGKGKGKQAASGSDENASKGKGKAGKGGDGLGTCTYVKGRKFSLFSSTSVTTYDQLFSLFFFVLK